jgi:hypothetical protein
MVPLETRPDNLKARVWGTASVILVLSSANVIPFEMTIFWIGFNNFPLKVTFASICFTHFTLEVTFVLICFNNFPLEVTAALKAVTSILRFADHGVHRKSILGPGFPSLRAAKGELAKHSAEHTNCIQFTEERGKGGISV